MDGPSIDANVKALVKRFTDQMTIDELAAINLAVLLGSSPEGTIGYDKAKGLFSGGDKMHSTTARAFKHEVSRRLAEVGWPS